MSLTSPSGREPVERIWITLPMGVHTFTTHEIVRIGSVQLHQTEIRYTVYDLTCIHVASYSVDRDSIRAAPFRKRVCF